MYPIYVYCIQLHSSKNFHFSWTTKFQAQLITPFHFCRIVAPCPGVSAGRISAAPL